MNAYRNLNLNLPGGLVSLPVSLAPCVSESSDPSPKVIGPEGESLAQVYVTEDGEQVSRENTKRLFGDKVVTQEELSKIGEACKIKSLEIIEVCPEDQIDYRRAKGAYYVFSNKKNGNAKALNVFVQALKKLKSVAVVKWTPSSRQQLLALRIAPDGALVATVLGFASDYRNSDEDVLAHTEQKVTKDEIALGVQLLSAVQGNGASLVEQHDEAIPLKKKLIEGTEELVIPDEPKATPAGDLMEQLQASLAATGEKVAA